MTAGTDTALRNGLTIGCLDGGGMLVDRESGEYVPAEQVIHDPLHIDKLDFLDEDHLGPLKGVIEEEDLEVEISESDCNAHSVQECETDIEQCGCITKATQKMLTMNGPQHAHPIPDVDTYCPASSRKGRWHTFGKRKP